MTSVTSTREQQLTMIRLELKKPFLLPPPTPVSRNTFRVTFPNEKETGDGIEVGDGDKLKEQPPATFISKSARKRSKKRVAKKGVMNIIDFCNGLAKSSSAAETRSPPLDVVGISTASVCPPRPRQIQQTAPSSSNSYASVVSGKASQDAFDVDTDVVVKDNLNPQPLEALLEPMTKNESQQIGQTFAEKEFIGQETQVESSELVGLKKDVAIQTDLDSTKRKPRIKKVSSLTQATMTDPLLEKTATGEKAITAKLCNCCDDDKIPTQPPPPVEFLGEQFRFEAALALAVSSLGGVAFTEDVFEYETNHLNLVEFQTYTQQFQYVCPFQFFE